MKMEEFSKRVKNTVGKGEIAHYKQLLLYPMFSNDLICRHIKAKACLGKAQCVLRKKPCQQSSVPDNDFTPNHMIPT